jgi:hypothetical protein
LRSVLKVGRQAVIAAVKPLSLSGQKWNMRKPSEKFLALGIFS